MLKNFKVKTSYKIILEKKHNDLTSTSQIQQKFLLTYLKKKEYLLLDLFKNLERKERQKRAKSFDQYRIFFSLFLSLPNGNTNISIS